MESPLTRRTASGSSCSTRAEGALWGSVREYERGPADPVDNFKNGPRVGGNKVPTREKGDEVAKNVDSSFIKKKVERPPRLRGNDESSFNRDLGVSVSAFPHLRLTATAGREV